MAISSRVCFCSDRSGRRSFISIDLELYTCVSILYLFLPSAISLIIARFLQCIAASFFQTVIVAAVGDQPPKEKEGTNIATFGTFFTAHWGSVQFWRDHLKLLRDTGCLQNPCSHYYCCATGRSFSDSWGSKGRERSVLVRIGHTLLKK